MDDKPQQKKKMERNLVLVSTVLILLAFLFQTSLVFKALEVLLLIFYAALRGKQFRLLPNLLILAGITGANLLTPVGEVLFRVASFPVTRFALEQGLLRALLFIGLVYLSRATVSCFAGTLAFPGRVGRLLGRTLYHFEQFMDFDISVKKQGFLKTLSHLAVSLDEALLTIGREDTGSADSRGSESISDLTLIFILLTTLLFLIFLIIMQ
jgi:hypothetical protein